MQLPFEVNNYTERHDTLGFGTYLAYFSRLLANPAWHSRVGNKFLMNEGMTEAEKGVRRYMNLALTNLVPGQQQQLANISIWELAKYLHANPADNPSSYFASQIQKEFGCRTGYEKEAEYFSRAWEAYSTVYFAD